MRYSLYSDGGVISVNPSPIGGTWAFVLVDSDGQIYAEGHGAFPPEFFEDATINKKGQKVVTNNQTELYALLMGFSAIPNGAEVSAVCIDSQVTIWRVWGGSRWKNVPQRIHRMFMREHEYHPGLSLWPVVLLDGHPTKGELLNGIGKRGHPVSKWNVYVDGLCRRAGEEFLRQIRDTQDHIVMDEFLKETGTV